MNERTGRTGNFSDQRKLYGTIKDDFGNISLHFGKKKGLTVRGNIPLQPLWRDHPRARV